jgi:uncharacterized protein YbbC (DUF1343 family)
MMRMRGSILLILCSLISSWAQDDLPAKGGAESLDTYLPLLQHKKIALVANHTSVVGGEHLVDVLIANGMGKDQLLKVFAPEHGFRGEAAAGQHVEDGVDPLTGIQVVSLYGAHKKPGSEELEGVELMVFDLQDVGARFYTYISTLHYVMEACAEHGVPLLVLDRPNPNGGYVDGPVLEPPYSSFVGMHPIPVVYGLTIGELAGMINEEGWLKDGVKCELKVIPCEHYYHGKAYSIPVSPSPNLANDHAIRMYPSTCFFEGTVISEGRGTPMPFEVYGHPELKAGFSFTPVSIPGVSGSPKFKNELCYGEDLRDFVPEQGWNRIHLRWLLKAYHSFPRKAEFFTPFFEKLAGTAELRKQIEAGWSESRIRNSWQQELEEYKQRREKYLIYE